MSLNFLSINDLTWQGQRASTCRMESTDNLANAVSNNPLASDSDPGTLANLQRAQDAYLRDWWQRREDGLADCHLYFIQIAGGRKPVKIGKAKNPLARLSQIQISCPYELKLRGTLEGCGHWEPIFHVHLARDRMRGEWFRWSCNVEALVKLALSGGDWKAELEPQRDHLDPTWFEGSPLYAPVST